MARMAGIQVSLLPPKGGLRGEGVVVGVAIIRRLLVRGYIGSRSARRAVAVGLVLGGLAVLALLVDKAAHALG